MTHKNLANFRSRLKKDFNKCEIRSFYLAKIKKGWLWNEQVLVATELEFRFFIQTLKHCRSKKKFVNALISLWEAIKKESTYDLKKRAVSFNSK